MGEGFEACRTIFRFVNFASTSAMQQRAHNAPHVRVVVDDQKAQTIEVDANHCSSRAADAGRTATR